VRDGLELRRRTAKGAQRSSAIHTGVSRVSPFSGLLYDLSRVGSAEEVTSPPYDVISDQEQRRYREVSPYNVVRLEFNEKGADSQTRASQYTQAASELSAWRQDGILTQDEEPAYYPFEMDFLSGGSQHRVRGLICAVEIEPWGGSIIPHEHVMGRQVEDRLKLMREIRANISPVYSVYSGPSAPITDLLDGLEEPLIRLSDEAEVEHKLWRTRDDRIADWLKDEDLLIADGHHRYTVALAYRDEMRQRFGPGPWDQIMMLVVDATTEDPPVLPIHRMLLASLPEVTGDRAEGLTELLAAANDDELVCGVAHRDDAGQLIYRTLHLDGDPPTVCALHEQVLGAFEAGTTLRFTADAAEAEMAVSSGTAKAAFFLPPTSARLIRSVIDRGERMPQKSTFFWPKPRTGLVMRAMP